MPILSSKNSRNEKGQAVVEFMMVVPFFLLLMAATLEFAIYCMQGESFLLASFMNQRTAEVQTQLAAVGSNQYAIIEDKILLKKQAEVLLDDSTTISLRNLSGFLLDDVPGSRPQPAQVITEYDYQPITGAVFNNAIRFSQSNKTVLQPAYRTQDWEGNCLPGSDCPLHYCNEAKRKNSNWSFECL